MSFILDLPDIDDPDEIKRRFRAYEQYLESIRGHLPPSAHAFATTAPFRVDSSLHDAWVENLTVSEPSSGERSEVRSLEIQVVLLSAWHNGHIELRYRNVQSYTLSGPSRSEGHGD